MQQNFDKYNEIRGAFYFKMKDLIHMGVITHLSLPRSCLVLKLKMLHSKEPISPGKPEWFINIDIIKKFQRDI